MSVYYIGKKSECPSQLEIERKERGRFYEKFQELMLGDYLKKEPKSEFEKVSTEGNNKNKRTIETLGEEIVFSL